MYKNCTHLNFLEMIQYHFSFTYSTFQEGNVLIKLTCSYSARENDGWRARDSVFW